MPTETQSTVEVQPRTIPQPLLQRFENEWRQMREPAKPATPSSQEQ